MRLTTHQEVVNSSQYHVWRLHGEKQLKSIKKNVCKCVYIYVNMI